MFDLIRGLIYGLRAARDPRMDVRERCELSLRVWPGDIDPFLHVTNSRYLDFMNLGRLDLLVRVGLFQAAWRLRAPMLVGRIDLQYRRPLPLFQPFVLTSQLVTWDEKWFVWEHAFVSDGQTAARCLARATFGARGATVSPSRMLQAAGQSTVCSPLRDEVQTWLLSHRSLRAQSESESEIA